jgi:hypothetical protein
MKYFAIILVICSTTVLYSDDWPREISSSEGLITMYQPQVEKYSGNTLRARAAVSVVPAGKENPVFGAVWVSCRVFTDRPSRTVKLEEMEVRKIKFPARTKADTAAIAEALEKEIPRADLSFSLDFLLESIETAKQERDVAHELETTPPKIIITDHPAVLVRIDGEPIFTDVEGTPLRRVINTPYFIVEEPSVHVFYLRGGDIWFHSKSIDGPWFQTETTPQFIVDLSDQMQPDDEQDEDSTVTDILSKTGKLPEILVSTEPAELIATDGSMQFSPVEGTGLLYASNTPGRLFLEIETQRYFVLLSGRWYSSLSLDGRWTYIASDKLPADFKRIPPGSPCDDVLASVAGTIPAREAVCDAQIPQMAEVDRSEATTEVEYDGDPQFEPVENTGMEYAVNASTAVIQVNGRYYDCDRGIWFEAANPYGPWVVCVRVPKAIYTISPRYPIYNVRYVRIYNYTDQVVYVGYTAGYTGCYVYNKAVVYGTGYHYRPWFRHKYYARPWTWGFGIHYEPWTGWSFGAAWWRPQGWLAHRSMVVYGGWWGPANYHPVYRTTARPAYRSGYHPAYHRTSATIVTERTDNTVRRSAGATRTATIYDTRTSGIRRPVQLNAARPSTETRRPALPTPSVPQREPQPVAPPRTSGATRTPQTAEPPQPARTVPAPQPSTPAQPEPRPVSRPVAPAPVQRPEPQPAPKPEPPVVRPAPARDNNVFAAPDGTILRQTPNGWQQRTQNTWRDAGSAATKQGVVRDNEIRQRATERTSSFQAQPLPQAQPAPRAQPAPGTQPAPTAPVPRAQPAPSAPPAPRAQPAPRTQPTPPTPAPAKSEPKRDSDRQGRRR